MTKYFVNQEGGYIGGFAGVSPPSGSIEVPIAPDSALQIWDFENETWSDPVPTEAELRAGINDEANRRLDTVFEYDGTIYDFGALAKSRITGKGALAVDAIHNGAVAEDYFWHGEAYPFSWITADNTIVQLDAQQMLAMAKKAADWETKHVFAAATLKSSDPIPTDYTDDAHWPAQPGV